MVDHDLEWALVEGTWRPVCSTCKGNCGQCGLTGIIGNVPASMDALANNVFRISVSNLVWPKIRRFFGGRTHDHV